MKPAPPNPPALLRRRFDDGLAPGSSAARWAALWRRALLAQDGSATLICETVACGPVRLDLLHQAPTEDLPPPVRPHLPGNRFLERQVCLSHDGEAMMDNLTFVALDGLPPELRRALEQGRTPIGHILQDRLARKHAHPTPPEVLDRLFARCGLPDPSAARSYIFEIDAGPAMWITEVFRAGMRRGLPEA